MCGRIVFKLWICIRNNLIYISADELNAIIIIYLLPYIPSLLHIFDLSLASTFLFSLFFSFFPFFIPFFFFLPFLNLNSVLMNSLLLSSNLNHYYILLYHSFHHHHQLSLFFSLFFLLLLLGLKLSSKSENFIFFFDGMPFRLFLMGGTNRTLSIILYCCIIKANNHIKTV